MEIKYLQADTNVKCMRISNHERMKEGNSPRSWKTTVEGCPQDISGLVTKADIHRPAKYQK